MHVQEALNEPHAKDHIFAENDVIAEHNQLARDQADVFIGIINW